METRKTEQKVGWRGNGKFLRGLPLKTNRFSVLSNRRQRAPFQSANGPELPLITNRREPRPRNVQYFWKN